MATNEAPNTAHWLAGRVADCEGGVDHSVNNIHVTVRCVCGAAFMSTDATLALGMAEAHRQRAGVDGG